jgi:imidazolonepropionase-like amidohydrolase
MFQPPRRASAVLRPALALVAALLLASPLLAGTERFTVLVGGNRVGFLEAVTTDSNVVIRYDYKNNGRGPTIAEALTLGPDGLPRRWTIEGATTFGNKVAESFAEADGVARWTDASGSGEAKVAGPRLYIAQSASPWATGLYARTALASPGNAVDVLPGGTLRVTPGPMLTLNGAAGPLEVQRLLISGIDMDPTTILVDRNRQLVALVSPWITIVRAGYEGEDSRLRTLAAQWNAERMAANARAVTHRPGAPLRIANVRLFDPQAKALTPPVSVRVEGQRIAAVEGADARRPGEIVADGAGGTLVPGLFEMHAHLDSSDALLDIAAGVTSVREMGNDNEVLAALDADFRSGRLVGPRVTRAGFIEGKSPFNSNNGIIVSSEAEAVAAVNRYDDMGLKQIKIYNSINPQWVPAMVKAAHARGMRVSGHVPAFTTSDAMMSAGYDELTHSNQLMLSWVLAPEEDTRTLLRLTALKRLANYDLASPAPQKSFALMAEKGIVHDPTLTILEALTTNRNGQVPAGAADWFDHLPPGAQRDQKQALADTSAPGDDAAYRAAFQTTLKTVGELHRRGVFIVPGTDYGGWLWLHRELELYEKAGMTRGEVLARATLESARYLGQDASLGSIAPGKLADFFLIAGDPTQALSATKSSRMVVKDGLVFFPDEIYPLFGIRPFATRPTLEVPQGVAF